MEKKKKSTKKKKEDIVIIETPNKDVIASYIFALSRKKEISMIEQRAMLRIVEYAQDYGLSGLRIKDNLRQIDLGLDRVTIAMPITDIALTSHYKPEDVENGLKALRSRAFIYRYKDKDTGHPISLIAGVLDKAEVEYGKGMVTLHVDNQVWGMITNFALGFRRFELNKALALPTQYALQFYMMISGQKRPYFMSVEELKDWLGIDPDKYITKDGKHRIDHLEERVLIPSKSALDETCPYSFTYTKIRENPKNSKSKVIGFNFNPVYLPQNRDEELEKARLQAKIHASGYLSRNVRDILMNKVGMTKEQLNSHIDLWENVAKYLIDPELTITKIFDRSRVKNPENPIGYLINALKGEIEDAKKKADAVVKQQSLFEQPNVELASMNDDKSVMDALYRVEKKGREKHYKQTFTEEQLQSTFTAVAERHPGMTLQEWVFSLGYKYDEERKVYFK